MALIPYQPGFSRDFPIYYFLISYIYLINRYLQVNFLVPSRRHKFDPYLKNLHLIHNYLHHTDQFPISACFQSFWSALFSAVSSPISTTMHYSPRLSQHHSTETAVLRVVSDIRVALDVGHVSLLLLLDMSAAFDTVDHDILIARLYKTFAVRQTPLQLFRTYLSGRSQTILSSSSCSAKQLIQSGVPQGSVLGPILFSLYVSDIAGIVAAHGLSSHQYADDTQIYGHCRPEGVPDLVCRVSTCFREIVSWTSSNRLRLNPDKTEAIWFGSPAGCSRIGSPTLQLTGATIIPSQTVRSLGMYLDSSLTMGPHVGRVAAGCYAKLRVLKEAKPFVPHNIFISLIVQLILSKLDYCNSILVNASCRNLNTLQAVMNTAARLIYGRRSSDHITPLLMDLHWLRIPENHLQNPPFSLQSRRRQRSSIPHRTFDKYICYPR